MTTGTVTHTDVSIVYVRPESPQLFFLFVGVWESMTIHALDFLRATAIGDRNIVILKDPHHGSCYQRGLSDEHDSLDGIVRWQRELIASRFGHVRELFCAGASAGGSPAIHTGCRLRARAAWSLGGRIVRPHLIAERDRVAAAFYRRVLGRPRLDDVTPEEHERLVRAFDESGMRQVRFDLMTNPETAVAHDRVAALVDLIGAQDGPTDFHFYYATTNPIDRAFAEAFHGCPGVRFHPFTPEPKDWSRDVTFRDPDHQIVQMLLEMGELPRLFAAYL